MLMGRHRASPTCFAGLRPCPFCYRFPAVAPLSPLAQLHSKSPRSGLLLYISHEFGRYRIPQKGQIKENSHSSVDPHLSFRRCAQRVPCPAARSPSHIQRACERFEPRAASGSIPYAFRACMLLKKHQIEPGMARASRSDPLSAVFPTSANSRGFFAPSAMAPLNRILAACCAAQNMLSGPSFFWSP